MATSDALPIPIKNLAFRLYFEIRTAAEALVTSWTGADSEVSLDGGTFTDCSDEAHEIGTTGIGYIDLTASEMNADCVIYKLTVTNTGAVPLVLYLYPAVSTGLEIPVNATAISGDITAADNLESATDGTGYNIGNGSVVVASVTASVTAASVTNGVTLADGAITAAKISASAITSAKIATDAIGADQLAASAVAEIQSGLALAGSEVTVSSPVAQNGDITIRQGKDYSTTISTQVAWTLTNPPGIAPTSVTFTCRALGFSKACSYSNPTITLELTAAETAALSAGNYDFSVEAVISGLNHPGLVDGVLTVERDL